MGTERRGGGFSGAWEAGTLSPLQDPEGQALAHWGSGGRSPRDTQRPTLLGQRPEMAEHTVHTSVPGLVFTPVFPSASQPPRPLFNTRAILPGGHLAWLPKSRLWEQSDLISNEDSANYSLCEAGQVPRPLWAYVTLPILWFHSVVEIDERSLHSVSSGAWYGVSVQQISTRGYWGA